jgi:hypothetical protein
MLTLLKQARAHGLGVVLATQNPVDLDYKGLANAGTWFLGRLQTERDKLRVLDGLEGASLSAGGGFDRAQLDRVLSGLGSRVFLMHDVHEDAPVVFQSRWALSYLRGPLTREQIARLMQGRKAVPAAAARTAAPQLEAAPAAAPGGARPLVPPPIEEGFLASAGRAQGELCYRPALLASASLHHVHAKAGIDFWRNVVLLAPAEAAEALRAPWEAAELHEGAVPALAAAPEPGARFAALAPAAAQPASYRRFAAQLEAHLFQSAPLRLLHCAELGAWSQPGESEGAFRAQLRQLLHERRDRELEKLRQRYAPKLARLEERIRGAQGRVEREQSQYEQQKVQTAVSIGATLLGALFGRKLASAGVGRATTAARGVGRAARERGDVARAQEGVEDLERELAALEGELEQALAALRAEAEAAAPAVEEMALAPRKGDLALESLRLAWLPWRVDAQGVAHADFALAR